jgi:hypothetical protein
MGGGIQMDSAANGNSLQLPANGPALLRPAIKYNRQGFWHCTYQAQSSGGCFAGIA